MREGKVVKVANVSAGVTDRHLAEEEAWKTTERTERRSSVAPPGPGTDSTEAR